MNRKEILEDLSGLLPDAHDFIHVVGGSGPLVNYFRDFIDFALVVGGNGREGAQETQAAKVESATRLGQLVTSALRFGYCYPDLESASFFNGCPDLEPNLLDSVMYSGGQLDDAEKHPGVRPVILTGKDGEPTAYRKGFGQPTTLALEDVEIGDLVIPAGWMFYWRLDHSIVETFDTVGVGTAKGSLAEAAAKQSKGAVGSPKSVRPALLDLGDEAGHVYANKFAERLRALDIDFSLCGITTWLEGLE